MGWKIDAVLNAMKASHIPMGERGLWSINFECVTDRISKMMLVREGRTIPPGVYVYLWRKTLATMLERGECVMNDTPGELRKHLQFVLQARGRVLVTGLGLGCVVRGLLENPFVESVDVVERDAHVMALVAPHMPADSRLLIHQDDARRFVRRSHGTWDCAWHDLWSNPDEGEPHLQVIHTELIAALAGKVPMQGAWALPRKHRRALAEAGVI